MGVSASSASADDQEEQSDIKKNKLLSMFTSMDINNQNHLTKQSMMHFCLSYSSQHDMCNKAVNKIAKSWKLDKSNMTRDKFV